MNTRTRILGWCLILYAATALVTLSSVWQHVLHPVAAGLVQPIDATIENGVIFFVAFSFFTFGMVRFLRAARVSLALILPVALVVGVQFILAGWISNPWSIGLAIAFVVALQVAPLVITHDIVVMLGIGGIAGLLGMSLTPLIACVILALLALYDIVSVYRTRHMVALAERMLESGAVFGFLIPPFVSGFFERRDVVIRERSVMMLGSGDIGLPLILASSALSQSVGAAIAVTLSSLVGVGVMQWLFARQEQSAPMAALPPIALAAILGYLGALLLGI